MGQFKHHFLMVCTLLWVFSQVGAAFAATDSVREDAGFEGGNVRSIPREPDPETHLPVTERSFPEFQAKGLLVGRLRVLPSLGVQTIYRDNLFATKNNKVDDLAVVTIPTLEAYTEDERHFFSAKLQSSIARYVENDSEDYEDYNFS
ncbi:MAG: outer membrane beta-barrel protein, partial [Bdellovibrionales bacterium]